MSNITTKAPLGDGYRWLGHEEIFESGDQYQVGWGWMTISELAVGCAVRYDLTYRRKIHPPTTKPPLGLMPRNIWIDNRKSEVIDAIHRYLDAGKDVPAAWLEELIELTNPK